MPTRAPRRLATLVGSTAAIVLALAAPAAAHVEAEAIAADAGRTAIDLSFHHGCDGEATTELRVQVPDGATDVTPQAPDGWQAEVAGGEVDWTGGTVPDGDEATFTVEMVLSQAPGTVVALPTIQVCGDTETAWIQQVEPGQPEPENPAPTITVPTNGTAPSSTTTTSSTATSSTTAASSETTESGPTTTARMTVQQTPITPEGSETNNVGLLVGGFAVAVIVIGALVLYLRHRTPRGPGGPGGPGSGTGPGTPSAPAPGTGADQG